MGRFFGVFFCVFLLTGLGWAQAPSETLVTGSFKQAELVVVLDNLAKQVGAELYFVGNAPELVTAEFKSVPFQEAIHMVLQQQNLDFRYRLVEQDKLMLLVAESVSWAELCEKRLKKLVPPSEGLVRMEYLLDEAPAAKVVDFLGDEYDKVEFSAHPTLNGFYARGSREDLLQIKRELATLDRVPEPPAPPRRELIPVDYADVNEVRGLLGTLVPDVRYNVDVRQNTLVVEGSPEATRQVQELLKQLGRGGHDLPDQAPPESESYRSIAESKFLDVTERPLSTFSIDVDTASYANVRRFFNEGRFPPAAAVRLEEMVNYFRYDYPEPDKRVPFSLNTELTDCPWNKDNQLLRVGLQGRRSEGKMRPRNLVFLLDVSGSMNASNKLPLVQDAMQLLLDTLNERDRVAIVTYAGQEGLHLPSTSCDQKTLIKEKIIGLRADGSTNGAAGIQLAYKTARENFRKNAINRVILCTDGDFNVGLTGGSLISLIEKEREGGVFLSVLGFGTGNIKDDTLESLADKGNGNYAYIDTLKEAEKVLVREASGTFEVLAKDVKLQIEFNPLRVRSYRLLGYENRRMEDADFSDDLKDAGELGTGHNVTAFYELITKGTQDAKPLRYQKPRKATRRAHSQEIGLIKLRYKKPNIKTSKLLELPVSPVVKNFRKASKDFRFSTSVAAFALRLRGSKYKTNLAFDKIAEWARSGVGGDPQGSRLEFLQLVRKAESLARLKRKT